MFWDFAKILVVEHFEVFGILVLWPKLQKTTELPPIANCSGETELLKFPKPNLEYGELVDS